MPGHDVSSRGLIEGFIDERVIKKGLDGRTEKAYRLDLERFSQWLEGSDLGRGQSHCLAAGGDQLEDWMEAYLDYLSEEKKLSPATV